jgi:arylsulfate sulfotransferase
LIQPRVAFCAFIGALLLISGGCATSSFVPFETAVTSTANPLVAQYSVTHYRPGYSAWVEFGTDTTYGRQTSAVSAVRDSSGIPGRSVANVLVAGMLPKTTYHMRAHVDSPSGSWVDDDQTFSTGAIGINLFASGSGTITAGVPSGTQAANTGGTGPAPGIELLTLASIAATDLSGNVIWYCPQTAFPAKLMPNGHFLMVTTNDLLEVDLACNVLRDVSVAEVNQSLQTGGYSFTIPPPLGFPGGAPFHHDVLGLPNGHWIALCQIEKTFTDLPDHPGTNNVVGDALVDIDPNGNVVWAWSEFDHLIAPYGSDSDGLDPDRNLQGWPDWTHSNAILYTADGNLLLSIRHQSWIIKIDYENGSGMGDVLWKLGSNGDFTLLAGDLSQWFYAQHDPFIVDSNGSETTLAIFDNGNLRLDPTGTIPCGSSATAAACYSRTIVLKIDESTRLANLLWEYLPRYYSYWGGDALVLPNGNVEFDATIPFSSLASQITEMTQTNNPQVVWQMNITGQNAYRGMRIPSLYPGITWQK